MRLTAFVAGVFAIATGAAAQVSLQIEIPAGRSEFRVGEAIGVQLTFDPAEPGWSTTLVQGRTRSVLGIGRDRFVVSPTVGTRDPWEYRLHGGIAYSGPGPARVDDKPVIVDLNQWVRFERPGHYTISVQCHVMGPQREDVPIESNRIGIDIVAADSAWQAQELAGDFAVLSANESKTDSQSFNARMDAAQRIAYLDTPAAVRGMARLLGTADIQTAQIFADGLRSTRYGSLAVAAMQEELRSPAEPVPPIFLNTLASIDNTVTDRQNLLAGIIDRKQGAAKAISIKTLLDGMSAERVPANLRAEIAALFPDLPSSQQNSLLDYEWKKIDGPEMIPVLRHIYETAPQNRYPENPLLGLAVERLYELDTSRTRALLLEEMKRREPRLPYNTLAMLPDATLPELDSVLLDNLQHGGGAAELIGRYATSSILGPVKEFYMKRDADARSHNNGVPLCQASLVAYFLRVEPAWGETLFRQTLAERGNPMGRCWVGIVGQTAAYYSGPAWEKVATDALQDSTVPVKIDSVKSLGQYGTAESKAAVFGAFRYWHQWWENRGELNEENRRLEQAFLEATTRPRNWTPSDADLATIREMCLTTACKSQTPPRSN